MLGKKKQPYKEGDWFAVPLREGGYAVGLIARSGGVLFGYFFGPKREKIPGIGELRTLVPENAVLVGQFGDLGLFEGGWPLIGYSEPWDRNIWPMLPLVRIDAVSGEAWLVEYSDSDPIRQISITPCDPAEAKKFPKERLMGSGAVEIRLTKLLSTEQL